MKTFLVFYYGDHIDTFQAVDRRAASVMLGNRYGGMAGLYIEQAA